MKKTALTFLSLLVGAMSYAQISNAPIQKSEIRTKTTTAVVKPMLTLEEAIKNHDYPVLKNSGNPDKDYKEAKLVWKKQNPELYGKLFPSTLNRSNSPKSKLSPGSFGPSIVK